MTINLFKGSILEVDADVLVNPANSFLMNGAGLAKVIENAAQQCPWNGQGECDRCSPDSPHPDIAAVGTYQQWRANKRLIPYGGAVLSPPGGLHRKFKGIIHAVGPIWGGGQYYEPAILCMAVRSCLDIAEGAGFKSIVFPAISAGIFGVPIEVVAEESLRMTRLTRLDVTFALMEDAHMDAFRKLLSA